MIDCCLSYQKMFDLTRLMQACGATHVDIVSDRAVRLRRAETASLWHWSSEHRRWEADHIVTEGAPP